MSGTNDSPGRSLQAEARRQRIVRRAIGLIGEPLGKPDTAQTFPDVSKS
jgi:hypothetical protein